MAISKLTERNEWRRILFSCAFLQTDEKIIEVALESLPALTYSSDAHFFIELIGILLARARNNFSVSVSFHT